MSAVDDVCHCFIVLFFADTDDNGRRRRPSLSEKYALAMTSTTTTWESVLWILTAAFLWGATDPLLKRFGGEAVAKKEEEEKKEKGGGGGGVLRDLAASFSDWKYAAAFAANQLGSAAFLVALSVSDVTVAVPAANGLKFAFTAAVGRALGEEPPPAAAARAGLALIVAGCFLQMAA